MEPEDYVLGEQPLNYLTTASQGGYVLSSTSTDDSISLNWVRPADHFIKFTEHKTGKTIGRLYEEDGVIKFEGQVDESAKLFFDQLIKHQLDELEARYKSLSCRIKWDAVK
jgi:hypothetical protein